MKSPPGEVKKTDSNVAALFKDENVGKAFLTALGFKMESTVLPPAGNIAELQAAYQIVFALWGSA